MPGLCIPTVAGPWSPGSTKVKVKQMAALTDADTCNCVFGGTISIKMAGQMKVKEG